MNLRIVDAEVDTDLRTITWSGKRINKIASRNKLRHGQLIYFTNRKQDRVRMVMMLHSTPMICVLPYDRYNKTSVYLRVNEQIAKLSMQDRASETVRAILLEKARKALKRAQQSRKRKLPRLGSRTFKA